jgi:hypothetical protein
MGLNVSLKFVKCSIMYMENAFPVDELKPLSCKGEDTPGGYALH